MEKNFNEYTAQEQVPIVLANNADTIDALFKTLTHEQCVDISKHCKEYKTKLEKDIRKLEILQELVLLYK